ncbi:Calcium-dependent lipid-binding family protein [Perilla frutescens var. hirtella]|nr:Calcium-dependent lipid-binding family protein [Perilla frutescens var. frutescens]KAH6786845.1 Calcium-dependent lipid-binding family protein [Perilla frutescens var. hirtella]
MAPGVIKAYQLLEVNLISAQDLEPVTKKMKTYCKAWVHTNRKLTSCVDTEGNNNPTWNDKFVFRVNDDFLQEDNSAVMIEIHTPHWFRDALVGTVRVLIGNLFPPTMPTHVGMRFVALQVRRPSGRPQGILNIGVALLDGSLRSMPLPILLRSRSERSIGFDNFSTNGSMVGVPMGKLGPGPKNSSILSISDVNPFVITKVKGKASSVINGAELREKPTKKGKASSVLSDSVFSTKEKPNMEKTAAAAADDKNSMKPAPESIVTKKVVDEKLVNAKAIETPKEKSMGLVAIGKPVGKYNGCDYAAPKGSIALGKYVAGGPYRGSSILSASEIGPSPSEVAAAMMAERRYPLDDKQSSVLDGWSLDEDTEGLRSKLERWRTELPPLYDHHGYSSVSHRSSAHTRSHSDSSSGLFSCFGNICGYECQCVCGQPSSPRRRNHGSRFGSSVGTSSPGRSSLL